MSIEVTPQELAITMAQLQELREELMRHANLGCMNNGFRDRQARLMAVLGTLLGAAQLYALSQHGGLGAYEIFRSMCAVMAATDARKVVANSAMEIGPEAGAGGLILPNGGNA